jgi:hypothetical protein
MFVDVLTFKKAVFFCVALVGPLRSVNELQPPRSTLCTDTARLLSIYFPLRLDLLALGRGVMCAPRFAGVGLPAGTQCELSHAHLKPKEGNPMNSEIDSIKQHLSELTAKIAAQQIALKFLARDLTNDQLYDLANFATWEHAQLRQSAMTDLQFGLVPGEFQKLYDALLTKTPKPLHEISMVDMSKLPFPW